jgi:hypothetical protein
LVESETIGSDDRMPTDFVKDIEAMPKTLRRLLEDELDNGNEIVELGHTFPAPPVGAYFLLAHPVMTRRHETGHGLIFFDRNNATYSGEFTDKDRFYFILEPPHQQDDFSPNMQYDQDGSHKSGAAQDRRSDGSDELQNFERSIKMDYEKWHDGEGYDLTVIDNANETIKAEILNFLLVRPISDWRDVQALARFDSDLARRKLKDALKHQEIRIRLAVLEYAPDISSPQERTEVMVQALRHEVFYNGLTQALDLVVDHHPKEIEDEMFRGILKRDGEVAVHFAAILMFLHKRAKEPFDMSQRPFFLEFNTGNSNEREKSFRELCEKIGVDADEEIRTIEKLPSGSHDFIDRND